MTKTIQMMLKRGALSGAVMLGLGATSALAQVEVRLFPPAPFIATTRPYYHQGRATYWYGNRWHYREGGQWHQYREEPRELREMRARQEFQRRHYERRDDRR